MFSMFKYLNPIENVSIKIYKKLFESLIKPILMYNSEIWYMDFYEKILNCYIDSLDTSFLEKVNLKFCKFVLGISKKICQHSC